MPATNITEEHRNAFEPLTSGHYDNFALFSCFLNDQPVAIVAATAHQPDDKDGETEFHIRPLSSQSSTGWCSPTATVASQALLQSPAIW